MTTAPAWQLYGRDFESETAMLSCAEVGAHVRCLCWSWPNGPLPGDLRALASIMRARTPREAATMWTQIAPLWTATSGGFVNSGLEAQRERHATYRALQATKGLASAAAKARARATGPQPAHQPEGNRTSTTVEPRYQPGANSSICDLQTSVKDQDQNHRARKERAPSSGAPPGFDELWAAYPNHRGKADAVRAFKKVDATTLPALLAAITWQRQQPQWTKAGGQYVPLLASWLNGRRWEDEPFHGVDPTELAWERIRTDISTEES